MTAPAEKLAEFDGSLQALTAQLYDREAMHRLMGFEDIWEFEKRWLDES